MTISVLYGLDVLNSIVAVTLGIVIVEKIQWFFREQMTKDFINKTKKWGIGFSAEEIDVSF